MKRLLLLAALMAVALWTAFAAFLVGSVAYFSPSWTAFQADRGRDFSVIVDGVSN
jgi:hypothetical protein